MALSPVYLFINFCCFVNASFKLQTWLLHQRYYKYLPSSFFKNILSYVSQWDKVILWKQVSLLQLQWHQTLRTPRLVHRPPPLSSLLLIHLPPRPPSPPLLHRQLNHYQPRSLQVSLKPKQLWSPLWNWPELAQNLQLHLDQVCNAAFSQTSCRKSSCCFFPCTCVLFFSVCGKANSDIVFLVDESSSIGVNNFIKMKDFIFRVATYFPVIGPQGTQVCYSVEIFLYLHVLAQRAQI